MAHVGKVLCLVPPALSRSQADLERAFAWFDFLCASEPEATIISPALETFTFDDDRLARDAERVVACVDGLILISGPDADGGVIQARALSSALSHGKEIHDLIALGPLAPSPGGRPGVLAHVEQITREAVRLATPEARAALLVPRCACGAQVRDHDPFDPSRCPPAQSGEVPAIHAATASAIFAAHAQREPGDRRSTDSGPRVVATAQQCDQMHGGLQCERPFGHRGQHSASRVGFGSGGEALTWDTEGMPA